MLLYDKVFAGLRSYALAKLVTQAISWAGLIYTVRRLDSHAFGAFGIAMVILSYGTMIFEGGLLESLIQHPPQSKQERRSVFTALHLAAVCFVVALIVVASPLSGAFGDAALSPVLSSISVILLLTAFSVLPLADLMRQMNFKALALISSAQALAATCTSVSLAYYGYGVWALAWGAIAGTAVRAVLLNVSCRGWEWPTWRLAPVLRYTRFAGTLVADNLLFRWYTTVDSLFLGRWVGTSTLGYYTLAQDVANVPLEKISNVVNDVSLPAYSQLQSDPPQAGHLMLETMRTHATVGFPLFWGMAAVAAPAVLVLFGEKWAFAITPLMALAFAGPFRLIGSIETPALTGIGRPDVLLKTKLVLAPCMTVAFAVGCSAGGLLGAALVWVLVFPVVYGFCFRWVLSHLQLSFVAMVRAIRGPCIAAAVMAGIVFGCDNVLYSALPIVRLIAGMALGTVIYPALLRWLDPQAFELLWRRLLRVTGLASSRRVAVD